MTKILDTPRNDKIEQLYQEAIKLPSDEARKAFLGRVLRDHSRIDMILLRGALIDWARAGRKPGPMPRQQVRMLSSDEGYRGRRK